MSFTNKNKSLLLSSVSCHDLIDSQVDSSNELSNMWTAFSKCKSYIENGTRLEYMSWRLWHRQQSNNCIDNKKNIKQLMTSLLSTSAYSHEVSQQQSTIHHASNNGNSNNKQQQDNITCSSFRKDIMDPSPTNLSLLVVDAATVVDHDDDDNEDDDDDYYLSDDEEENDLYDDEDNQQDEQDNVNYHFVKDFKKTQPRPADTPRRSLLSDLLQRVSSPPLLLSNSSSSFTSSHSSTTAATQSSSSLLLQDEITTTDQLPTNKNDPSDINRWRESFHGW